MHRDRWIDSDPARVARDAPDWLAERMKLAHQSTANVTGGSRDERADHAERRAYAAQTRTRNQVEDYTSPVSDLMGGRSRRAHAAHTVASQTAASAAKQPPGRGDRTRRRAIADDGGRRRRPHAPPERDPKCPGAVTCNSTADVASVTALTPSGHVVDGRAVAIVAKRSVPLPGCRSTKEERRLPPSGRARRCPDHADATVRHRGRLLLLGARGRCTRRVPRFAAGAAGLSSGNPTVVSTATAACPGGATPSLNDRSCAGQAVRSRRLLKHRVDSAAWCSW